VKSTARRYFSRRRITGRVESHHVARRFTGGTRQHALDRRPRVHVWDVAPQWAHRAFRRVPSDVCLCGMPWTTPWPQVGQVSPSSPAFSPSLRGNLSPHSTQRASMGWFIIEFCRRVRFDLLLAYVWCGGSVVTTPRSVIPSETAFEQSRSRIGHGFPASFSATATPRSRAGSGHRSTVYSPSPRPQLTAVYETL